jgi:Calcineurin-like phosphoesterase
LTAVAADRSGKSKPHGKRVMRRAASMLGLLMIVATVAFGARPVLAAAAASPAWIQMTATGAEARAMTSLGHCPFLTIDGRLTPMQTRAPADAAYPLTLCQLNLPQGVREVLLNSAPLPLPKRAPQRILVFGDTGCRVKEGQVQDCNDPRRWPFGRVAALAAMHQPDLVVHVGDYYYRESPCPPGERQCAGSPYGDNLATWRAEFFDPAQPLLAVAPWVFVRGNHESCGRGGRGWFRMLDAGPAPSPCPALSAPFKVDLGGLNLYVLDSADTSDQDAPATAVTRFSRQLSALSAELAHGRGWIVTHRPVWGLTPVARLGPIGPLEVAINKTEQTAVAGHDLAGVQMIVSGHIHHFAAYDFGPPRPAQLIAGTGGDIGEDADLARIRTDHVDIDGQGADRLTFDRFGYFLLDRAGADWTGTFRDIDDHIVATCRLHERRLHCAPASGR